MSSLPVFAYSDNFIFILILLICFLSGWVFWIRYMATRRARALFEEWKKEEFEQLHAWLMKEADSRAEIRAQALFQDWQVTSEQRIRQDAVKRSHSVMRGKMTEHLIPFFSEFPYNPSDARFLGSPVDFIVFDGLSEGELKQLVFVEIKNGFRNIVTKRTIGGTGG